MKKPAIERREQLGEYLNSLGLVGQGVEIGVAHGNHSRGILKTWKGEHLFMVDPFLRQSREVYKERTEHVNYETWYNEAKVVVAEFPGRCTLLREFSHEAATRFADGSLDFVYIDGNHAREAFALDIKLWWPKMKPGGLFGGHDFVNDTGGPEHWCEVQAVVEEWVARERLELQVCACSSWFTFKK